MAFVRHKTSVSDDPTCSTPLCPVKTQKSINCQFPQSITESPVLDFNLMEIVQDPLHLSPDICVSHDVEQVKEVFPVGGARVRGTILKSVLSSVEASLAELVGFKQVEIGVVDVNMLTCCIDRPKTSSLVLFPVFVDPSLNRQEYFGDNIISMSKGLA